jgi:hypothetical protein
MNLLQILPRIFFLTAMPFPVNNTTMILRDYFTFIAFSFWCGFFFRPSTRRKGLIQV